MLFLRGLLAHFPHLHSGHFAHKSGHRVREVARLWPQWRERFGSGTIRVEGGRWRARAVALAVDGVSTAVTWATLDSETLPLSSSEGNTFSQFRAFHFARTHVLMKGMGHPRVGTHCQVTAALFPAPRRPGTARTLWHGPSGVVGARAGGVGT